MDIKFIDLKNSYSKNLKVIPFKEEPFNTNFLEYYNSMKTHNLKQEEFIKK